MIIQNVIIFTVLVGMAFIDVRKKELPAYFVFAGIMLSVMLELFMGQGSMKEIGMRSIIGMVFLVLAFLTKEQIGYGDALVVIMIGITLGEYKTMNLLIYSAILSSITSISLLLLHKVKKKDKIPFIPFVAVAYFGVMLC